MADWADDDDDEEVWKDALQARVNQLELVFQNRVQSSSLLGGGEGGDEHSQGFANALRPTDDVVGAHGNRHKLQRTSEGSRAAQAGRGSNSCGTGRLAAAPPPSPQVIGHVG